MTYNTSSEVIATVKTLNAQVRALKKSQQCGSSIAHIQIAQRRIADAKLFAERNTEYAVKCCWEARHHINLCGE